MQIQNRLASALRTLSPRFPASVICLVLVLALHFWLPAVEPMPRLARITYNASAIFGGTVIVLQMARLLASGKPVLFSSLYQIVERIIWLLCFLSLIDSGANLVEGLILSMVLHPAPFLSLGLGIAVAYFAVSNVPDRQDDPALGQVFSGAARERRHRSADEIHRIAVHEAGHAMLFAVLPAMPSTISVSVSRDEGAEDLYRGAVTHSTEHPALRTESYIRWQMLLSLAGMVAELFIFGDRADGGSKDSREWLDHATFYLNNGLGEVWWQSPTSEFQLAHNRGVLGDLRDCQVAQLRDLFEANRDLLIDMAASLTESGLIERDALCRYLSAVQLTGAIRKLSQQE